MNLLLEDAPTLKLPTDKPRSTTQPFRKESQQFNLSPELTDALETLSCREEESLFITLAAAFQVLLHRYSGQDDIVIIGRRCLENEDLIDFTNKSLLLHTDLSGNPGFLELLEQVRKVVLAAYATQNMLFGKPIEELSSRCNNSAYQAALVLQDNSAHNSQLSEIYPEFPPIDAGTVKFDLVLKLSKTLHGLTGRIEYSTDLFETPAIDRLTGHFKALLEGIAAHPEAQLSELPLLTESERRQLLVEWNDTAAPFPSDKCIHELFEAQAAKTPQAVAVVYEDSRLSYAELNAQANRLAHQLREWGVKPDTLVAICVERCLNMVVGLLAILKAGGGYLPLDPTYPKDRLAFMLEDSSPVALLTQGRLESLFVGMSGALPIIDLETEHPSWANQPGINLDRHEVMLTPKHLAYVIYTSGSTGKAKGVMIEHINVVNFLSSMSKTPRLTCSDSLLAVTTVSFDIAGLELFLPLINGAKIILVSHADATDPVLLQKAIAQSGITVLQATPATWRLLLNSGWQGSNGLKALCGGEALATDLSTQLTEVVDELWNLYGPTETTIWSTCQLIGASRGERYASEPIGRPIDNTQIYILDAQLQPVPQGISGEIYIGGAGVARGYLNRPELTVERFVTDPFVAEADARMYKTGDMACWLADGSIEYQGRNDFQVKIRGFRIEIGEIEVALRQSPQLREAAVSVYEPVPGDKRLVAYLVPQSTVVPAISELRDFLKPKIPEFMIPSAFVFLAALPLTPNGKLDRKSLPKPDKNYHISDAEFIAPRNPMEQQLADVWSKVLAVNHIGIHDNFFELGGNSLLAVKIIADVNKLFNTELPLGAIYQSPTIEELAIVISSENPQHPWYSLVPIHKQGSRPPLFAIHTITLSDLPRYLGHDQPLYFLRYGMAAEIGGRPVHLPPLEELASHYIKELQQVQPEGPYYLMGFSFGGVITYEMARQLYAQGHQVNFVGLLDTYLTKEKHLLPLHRIIQNLFKRSPRQLLAWAKNKINYRLTSMENGTDFLPHIYTQPPDKACLSSYQAKTYKGRVTLFQGWTEENMFFSYSPPEQEWKKLLSDRLDVEQVSGSHFEIFDEPHVKILAAKLLACMG